MKTSVEELVKRYFNSWQEPADWEEFRGCLADDVVFDPGGQSVVGADHLTAALKATESPWKDVELLESLYGEAAAALLYEGTERSSGVRHRVSEHLTIQSGLIQRARVAIVQLPQPS